VAPLQRDSNVFCQNSSHKLQIHFQKRHAQFLKSCTKILSQQTHKILNNMYLSLISYL